MTSQTQTTSVAIDMTKLAQAIKDTKRGLSFYRCPPDTTHLDDLLARLRAEAR